MHECQIALALFLLLLLFIRLRMKSYLFVVLLTCLDCSSSSFELKKKEKICCSQDLSMLTVVSNYLLVTVVVSVIIYKFISVILHEIKFCNSS